MNGKWLVASVAILTVAAGAAPRGGVDRPSQDPAYAKQVSSGAVTLELTPEWQDTVLLVTVRAETRSGDLAMIYLKEQVRLVADRKVFTPEAASSLRGSRGVAWMIFRLPKKPEQFAISIRDVPDVELRILRWPAVALTP